MIFEGFRGNKNIPCRVCLYLHTYTLLTMRSLSTKVSKYKVRSCLVHKYLVYGLYFGLIKEFIGKPLCLVRLESGCSEGFRLGTTFWGG